jgi:hypothetical protein
MTLRLALLDYQATGLLPVPNGRRLVARILVRDELVSLFVQVGFIVVVVSVWLDPDALLFRSLTFVAISLALGVGSACRWVDRNHFWHNGYVREGDEDYDDQGV